jgi:predicted dehydrogenase
MHTRKTNLNRRQFLTSATAAAAFTIIPRHVLGGSGQTPPSDKVNIAGIGIGGMGFNNLRNLESQNIVALCDVDDSYADKVYQHFPNAKRYKDFRVMLDKQKDIDAVVIATPDHTHALITITAMQAGKHVYCQKPLTHTIQEARKVAQVARRTGVVTQMGNQGHSDEGIRRICEWIWDGAIGPVRRVEAWCRLTYFPPGQDYWCTTHYSKPEDKPPVPAGLDWDLWLGPASYRDYHSTYHPGRWRAWWDFGCGMMGDRGVHTLDAVFWALKLEHPQSIQATVTNLNDQTHPIASIVTYQFPARQEFPPVHVTWYEGLEPPRPADLEDQRNLPPEGGALFMGDKGTLLCGVYGESPQLIPYEKMKAYQQPQPTLPRIQGTHEEDWIRAIREKGKACSDFEYAAALTEMTLLGNIAKRVQTRLDWDGVNMKFTNHPDADPYLSKEYRDGWVL